MEAAASACCSTARHTLGLPYCSYHPRCVKPARYHVHGIGSRVWTLRHAWAGERAGRIPTRDGFRRQQRCMASAVVDESGAGSAFVGMVDNEDQILRCTSLSAEVSVIAVKATEVVQEAQKRHKASPTASAALGRALVGTLLLRAMKGDAETVQVSFVGDGPLGQMTTVAGKQGFVKGFVGNPLCDPPLRPDGKLDVGAAVGSGVLSVVRNNSSWTQPYTGTIPIYSGEVAEDIAHYLADSEQTNTAVGLGVSFTKDGVVKAAGGFLVQLLPFCSEETLAQVEKNILAMPPLSDAETITPRKIAEELLKGVGVGDFSDPVIPKFGPCGVEELKPRMMRAVASLGPSEVRELLDEQGHVEVRCEFCAEVIQFGELDLRDVLQPLS